MNPRPKFQQSALDTVMFSAVNASATLFTLGQLREPHKAAATTRQRQEAALVSQQLRLIHPADPPGPTNKLDRSGWSQLTVSTAGLIRQLLDIRAAGPGPANLLRQGAGLTDTELRAISSRVLIISSARDRLLPSIQE
ncbi:hypothetical protein HaLaN_03283, partial [Haematococcus lacustris]